MGFSTSLAKVLPFSVFIMTTWAETVYEYPAPISLQVSNEYSGDAGQWDTFSVGIGTPAQYVQTFISTASQQLVGVLPQGCTGAGNATYIQACESYRGGTYNPQTSSSWTPQGNYTIQAESALGIEPAAEFGYDTVTLGSANSGAPVLKNLTVGGVAALDYYVGFMGLNPRRTNFTETASSPSLIASLKANALIPSLSFGYTAGAKYRLRGVSSSVVLGGYDRSRFSQNGLMVSVAEGDDRGIVVGMPSISSTQGNVANFLDTGIYAVIDSTVVEMWLPQTACDRIAAAFNLTFDSATGLYFVDSATRASLNAANPNITISLDIGPQLTSSTLNITLPYYAFDLTALPPYQGLTTNQTFFPIRRAADSSQYVLGRTFLQEAYLSVDWERGLFNVSECIFEENQASDIISVIPVDSSPFARSKNSLSGGAIAGIVVGVVVGVAIIAGLAAFFFLRRRKAKRQVAAEAAALKNKEESSTYSGADAKVDGSNVYQKAELDAGTATVPAYGKHAGSYSELQSPVSTWRPDSSSGGPTIEMANTQREIFEMPGDTPKPTEMPDPAQLQQTEKEATIDRERIYNGVDPHTPTQ